MKNLRKSRADVNVFKGSHFNYFFKGNPKPGMCVGPCFQQAPASQLPFADQSFDAIMSTDVLEHVLEKDVPALIQEFARVTRKFYSVCN